MSKTDTARAPHGRTPAAAIPLPPGRNQQQQHRARQVEVGEKRIHRLPSIGRHDELAGRPTGGDERSAPDIGGGLEGARDGRADGDPAPTASAHGLQRRDGRRVDLVASSMTCAFGSSVVMGRNVPGPTCSTTGTRAMPTVASRSSNGSSEDPRSARRRLRRRGRRRSDNARRRGGRARGQCRAVGARRRGRAARPR